MYHKKLFIKLSSVFSLGFVSILILAFSFQPRILQDIFNHSVYSFIFFIVFAIIIILVFSHLLAAHLSKPLKRMKLYIESIAKGDFSNRMPLLDSYIDEVYNLGASINQVAEQLEKRTKSNQKQKRERIAVFESMVEGVIAIDKEQRVIHMNRAASEMLHEDRKTAPGKSIYDIVHEEKLNELIKIAVESGATIEDEIVIENDQKKFIQVYVTGLKSEAEEIKGILLVLHNITRLRKLEKMRSDFVSNVSHELKTPLTSIKGFIDTIIQQSIDNKEDLQRYLKIIQRHANRLEAIIQDLLTLSSIEKEEESNEIELEEAEIKPVISAAVQVCQLRAQDKDIKIDVRCDEKIRANINAALLEQAVVNLLDNAIKYSDEKSVVIVEARIEKQKKVISVKDSGCGIPKKQLPRIFQRFYRVDKARSRQLGGTGLGLSIVKHIAFVHNGRVYADSREGEGSTFYLELT